MGASSHIEDLETVAEAIAKKAKAIAPCLDCDADQLVSNGDEDANDRAREMVSQEAEDRAVDAAGLQEALDDVLEYTPEHCPECDRRRHQGDD